jgi:predicted ATPase/DNA-binding SARP family transcriptional activator/peroxiredoxin
MEFRILGPLEVLVDRHQVVVSGDKQRALLALLVVNANRALSAAALIDELWGERPPSSAAKTLQAHISRVRKALGQGFVDGGEGLIVTREHGYELRIDREMVDSLRFERLVSEARSKSAAGRVPEALSVLEEAVSLWRGQPLAEFAHERFAEVEISRLEELRIGALEELIDAKMALGRHAEVIGEVETLIARHPYRERLRAQLMLALYRADRQAEALDAYRNARRQLVDELGIEPGHELRELHEAVLAQDRSLEPATAALPLQGTDARSGLPSPANPLIGRHMELAAVRALLEGGARLVTVTGAGGSGKTRLALELAHSLAEESTRAVFFVPLAPVRDPGLLPGAIVSACGLREASSGSERETIKRALAAGPALLMLDNFEHLASSASLAADLLAACPQLQIVVTSRVSMHLSGEHEYPLAPLPLADAIALFTERARAVRPEFAADGSVLGAICGRLDCLPLAIELAAARSRLLSSQELLDRLEHRLQLLTGGPRDLESRQQTLRATIEWSFELLDPDAQQLFARLAVFTGGCTLEAAERVCGASLDGLGSLLDQNLLRRSDLAGESRFWMLETVREYALERLAVTTNLEDACRPYADYYIALARQRIAEHDHGQHAALDTLERDLDNVRTALAFSHDAGSVPVPVDDGACNHLVGLPIPRLVLNSTHGPLDLAELGAERLVLYVHPGTTAPGQSTLPGLSAIPGGLGCTPQALAFRDHAVDLTALGAHVAGLSIVPLESLVEFSNADHIPFPVLSDPERHLEAALKLPTFRVAGTTLYRRVTLIAEQGTIVKVFHPVFPPERNAAEVLAWITQRTKPATPEPTHA